MEFIKFEFLDHHKDSLDSGAKKKQKSQVQTFRREQKIKTDFSKSLILIGQTILDFGNSDF